MQAVSHLMNANEAAMNAAPARRERHIANAAEWLRRAHVSLADGNVEVARCQAAQAGDEMQLAGVYRTGVSVAARAVA